MPLLSTTRLPEGARFSQKRANKAINFIETACVHTKSAFAHSQERCTFRKLKEKAYCYKQHFILSDWQKGSATKDEEGNWSFTGILTPLFGAMRWNEMHKMWVRQFTMAWLEMARKNGKSELMAALGLYMLIWDGEWSAEVYGAASDKDQAAQVFDVARDMCYLSPVLRRMVNQGKLEIIDSRKRIVYTPTRSFYRVIAADAAGNLGANPYAILFDEVLAQPDATLWNYLRQGYGTRTQPLLIGVTTAGPNRESFAFTEHKFGERVAEDPNLDPKRFVYMAFTDESADWRDESKWYEANPALGNFLDIQFLRDEMIEIINKGDLSQIAFFKIFHLNQWGNASNLWLDVEVWRDSEEIAGKFTEDDLKGVEAFAGFDLAETMDFTAWVVVFFDEDSGRVMIKPRYWITEKAIQHRHKERMKDIEYWREAGFLKVFRGDAQDYDKIRKEMLEDIGEYGIKMFGFDPWQAPAIVTYLEGKSNAKGVKVPQLTTRMDPGAKELTRLMGLRRLTSNRHPILEWNVQNAGYKADSEGHVKPHKANSTGNIDGITALVNALVVKVVVPPEEEGQIFAFNDEEPLLTPEQARAKAMNRWLESGDEEDDDDF